MVAYGTIPHKLELLLRHPRVLKVGRLVNQDLTRLRTAFRLSQPFAGGVDLAKFAKDRRVIRDIQKCTLSDLCALVLQRRLSKNTPIRVNEQWENATLTQGQLEYAASDAYAALLIYEKLAQLHVPVPLSSSCPLPPAQSPILIYSSDNTNIIAEAQVSHLTSSQQFDGIHITSSHIILDVLRVLVPGALISAHHHRSLESFGSTPFSVVCLRSHACLYSPLDTPIQMPHPSETLSSVIGESSQTQLRSLPADSDVLTLDGKPEADDEQSPITSIADLMSQDLSEPGPSTKVPATGSAHTHSPDQPVRCIENLESWEAPLRSRVLKDIWHIFHMFYLSATHGLRKQFTRDLRDAFFVPDEEDRTRIDAWGASQDPPQSYEKLRNSSPQWIRQHCKHRIPPPHILHPLVAQVFNTYGSLVDPSTKKALFSDDNWKTAKSVLELIRNGLVSDPPGIPLYTLLGVDQKAGDLPIYRCARGTNTTEGGVHTHIRSRLPKFGASIRHIQASLLDYMLCHNILVCHPLQRLAHS